ncbi:MAG: PCI domain-containing protein [Promethearchaeota archaeon]
MEGKTIGTCKYCASKDIEYKCPTCNEEFCFKHTGSTDIYYCKKHSKYQLNRIQSEIRRNRCQIVEFSRCPSCGSFLEITALQNGQKYLQCTKCSWNSRANSPIIISTSEKQVLREAEKYGLSRHAEKCNERLKRIKGKNFCIDCFSKELQENIEISYYQISQKFGLNETDIELIVNEMLSNNSIEGFLDTKNKTFVHLVPSIEAKLVADLHSQGYLDLDVIRTQLQTSPSTTTRIMIELIRKNKLRGTFTQKKNRYFLEAGLTKLILQEIQNQGSVVHSDLAKKYDIAEGNVKNYIMALMKNKLLKAFFADSGKMTVSEEELENDIENFCIQKGVFMLTSLASHLKIAPELARRSLFNLIQKGLIRGIFTQNHEFITEEKLSEKIKAIARAYRTISIRDLAKKLAITEQRVEEGLATLISKGSVNGYIDMAKHQFVADGKQPVTSFESHPAQTSASTGTTAATGPVPKGKVEVVRQYDFVGGQLHFKVVVRNKSNMAIHDVKIILDVPSSYRRARELLTIPVVDPGNTHGVDFYLEPAECGISTIGGTVIYKDALGKFNTIYIKPKDVQIKCPLLIKSLDTIEDCQKAIQSLPSDARAFLIADLPAQMAYSAAHRAVAQFDVTNVASYENDKDGNYEAEAWFSSQAKVTGGRVITRVYINGSTSTLEIRVWCNEAGQLTGLLAKMIELLFVEINLMRQIKSEERNKTLDVMAITRNLMEISNICMLRYKASSARLKLEDTYNRLSRLNEECGDSCDKIYEWLKKLEEEYEDEEAMLKDDEADMLDDDIQKIHQKLQAQLGVV